jgi:hypothetical protein
MNPAIIQITAKSRTDDLMRSAEQYRQAAMFGGRGRRLLRRRRRALNGAPRVAVA